MYEIMRADIRLQCFNEIIRFIPNLNKLQIGGFTALCFLYLELD